MEDVGVPSPSHFQSGLAALFTHPQGTVHNVRDPEGNVPPSPQVQPGPTLFWGLGPHPFRDPRQPEGKVLWQECLTAQRWPENYKELSERELWVLYSLMKTTSYINIIFLEQKSFSKKISCYI